MVERAFFPRLCGGTFFTLLLQAKKQPQVYRKSYPSESKNDNHRNRDMLAALIGISSKYQKSARNTQQDNSLGPITTRYMACKISRSEYLPFTESTVIKDFDDHIKNEESYLPLLKKTQDFIDVYLDTEKSPQLVRSLIELILLDQSIEDTDELYIRKNGQPMHKSNIKSILEDNLNTLYIYLPAFLLGIWHFIIINRTDNTIGEATFNSWHKGSNISGLKKDYIGVIGVNIKNQIEFISIDDEDLDTFNSPAKEPSSSPAISTDIDVEDLLNDQPNIDKDSATAVSKWGNMDNLVPKAYRNCLFCENWEGNSNHAKRSPKGVYGICIIYNKDQRSTGGTDCPDYTPRYAEIATETLLSKFKTNKGSL